MSKLSFSLNMNSLVIVFLACMSSYALYVDFGYVGICLISWSTWLLFSRFIAVFKGVKAPNTAKQTPSVSNLLNGLKAKRSKHHEMIAQTDLSAAFVGLMMFGLALAAAVYWMSPDFSLQDAAMFILYGLIFWAFRGAAQKIQTAFALLWMMGVILVAQMLYGYEGYQSVGMDTFLWLHGAILMIGGGVFIYGLYKRRRHHVFPLSGLLATCFCVLFAPSLAAENFVFLSAFFGVCYAQSISSHKRDEWKANGRHVNYYLTLDTK